MLSYNERRDIEISGYTLGMSDWNNVVKIVAINSR